jgi:hypothetical protein
MDRIKRWASNLFWGVAGNALWTWLTGGVLVAGAAAALSWRRALGPVWLDRGITALIVLAAVMGGSAIQTLIRRRTRPREERPNTNRAADDGSLQIKEILNQTFKNQEVPLDGYQYISCIFENVTIVYNNGVTGGFDPSCRWTGSVGFKSREARIQQTLILLQSLKIIPPQTTRGLYTPILADLPDPASEAIVVNSPAELVSYWSRLISARQTSNEKIADMENTYEYLQNFWDELVNSQRDNARQRWERCFQDNRSRPKTSTNLERNS